MDSYENSEDDIDEMETILESSDEEDDSSSNIQKERDTIENFVNRIFKETAQSSPETEVPKEQVQEIKKCKK